MISDARKRLWRVEKARWPFPAVIVYDGSVWQYMVWGVTRRHAEKRAQRRLAYERTRG